MADRYRVMLLLTAAVLAATGCQGEAPAAGAGEAIEAVIGGRRYHLELALDKSARFAGLSDRDRPEADTGMLFVFPTPRQTAFVMRRCRFPIDLIFLGPGGRVDRLQRMKVEAAGTIEADLRRYPSSGQVQFAIELVGGELDRLGLEPGEKIDLPLADLKRRAR